MSWKILRLGYSSKCTKVHSLWIIDYWITKTFEHFCRKFSTKHFGNFVNDAIELRINPKICIEIVLKLNIHRILRFVTSV